MPEAEVLNRRVAHSIQLYIPTQQSTATQVPPRQRQPCANQCPPYCLQGGCLRGLLMEHRVQLSGFLLKLVRTF